MIDREYYKLDQAADIMKCTVDDLIYLGAKDELPIHILTDKFIVAGYHVIVSKDHPFILFNQNEFKTKKVSAICLGRLFAGADTECLLDIERIDGWPCMPELYHRDFKPTNDEVLDFAYSNTNMYARDTPVLLSECVLVIRHDDLMGLKNPKAVSTKKTKHDDVAEWYAKEKPDLGVMKVPAIVEAINTFCGKQRITVNWWQRHRDFSMFPKAKTGTK